MKKTFEEVYQNNQGLIFLVLRRVGIYQDYNEFYQIGLIALWEAHERYSPWLSSFSTYAYSYIWGRILTEIRKRRVRGEWFEAVPDERLSGIADERGVVPLEEETILAYCRSAKLTTNQTKWVLYYSLLEMKISEIAELENVASCTVKDWRSGALKKLRMHLGSTRTAAGGWLKA